MEKHFILNMEMFPADNFTPAGYQLKDTVLYRHQLDNYDDAFAHLYLYSAGRLNKDLSIKYHNDFHILNASVSNKDGIQLIKLEKETLLCNFSYASDALKTIFKVDRQKQASVEIQIPSTGVYAEMPVEYKALSDAQKTKFAKADMFDYHTRQIITSTPAGSQYPDGYVELNVIRQTSLREAYNQMLIDKLTPEGLLRAQRPGVISDGWYILSLDVNSILIAGEEIHPFSNHGLYKEGLYTECYHRTYLRSLLKEDRELRKIIREPLIEKAAIAISSTGQFDDAIATQEIMRYIRKHVPELNAQKTRRVKTPLIPEHKNNKRVK